MAHLSVVQRQHESLERLRSEHAAVMAKRVTDARMAGELAGRRAGRIEGVLLGMSAWAACFWLLSWLSQ